MLQTDVIKIIEDFAPLPLAAKWDRSGVQVASNRSEVQHLAVGLDPSLSFLEQALKLGADMFLTHHPLTLEPQFPDRLTPYHQSLSLLLSHNIPLYAAHTSLDANPQGPAAWLGREFGLAGAAPLEETGRLVKSDGAIVQGGLGCIGDLPASSTLDDIVARLSRSLSAVRANSCLRLTGEIRGPVSRLAICPGSGASLVMAAWAQKADLLITGDLKYHAAVEVNDLNSLNPDNAFAVLDVGHFSLEEEMTRRLAACLADALPDLQVSFIRGQDPFINFQLNP